MTAAPFKEHPPLTWWRSPMAIAVGLCTVVILLAILFWPSSSNPSSTAASEPVRNTPATAPATPASAPAIPVSAPAVTANPAPAKPATVVSQPTPKASTPAVGGATRVELVASEPTWVSIRGRDGTTQMTGLIEQGKIQSVDVRQPAVLRAGNAGGLTIRANGRSMGPLGPHGAIREVEFKNGDFKLIPVP